MSCSFAPQLTLVIHSWRERERERERERGGEGGEGGREREGISHHYMHNKFLCISAKCFLIFM